MEKLKNEIDLILSNNNIVTYEDIEDTEEGITATIGKSITGETIAINFLKNPHLLIGGSSGSGKSCLMNTIVNNLLKKYTDIYFMIIDVKRIEYLKYKNHKQLIGIATDSTDANNYLQKFVNILYNRFSQLEQYEVKDIEEYNQKAPANEKMHHFFVVVDETADLLLDNKNIKTQLQKLTQLGRAVGIHIITATQAPNCKTIPTEIKININCRIALQVPNSANSKIIIDKNGAELLENPGDAIIKTNNIYKQFKVVKI